MTSPSDPDPLFLDSLDLLLPGEARVPARRDAGRTKQAGNLSIVKMKNAHHRLAQLVAMGLGNQEISRQTGYHPTYVANLRTTNPAFRELVEMYGKEQEQIFQSVAERRSQVGMMALEELADRLGDPEISKDISVRELLEVHDQMLVAPVAARGPGAPGGSPSPVTIQFVQAAGPTPGVVIEGTPQELSDGT